MPRSLARVIASMRRAVIRFFLIDGVNKALLFLFGFVAISYLVDRNFRMDKPQRTIMLVLGAAAVLYALWRWLLRPLFSRLSDDALLLQAEQREGGLDERLISALELARMDLDSDPNVSRGMVHQTIERGAEAGRAVDLTKVLRFGRLRFNAVLLVFLGLFSALGAVSLAFFKPAQTWFDRNVLLGDSQWPQKYFLEIAGAEEGRLRVPRGDDWPVVAKVVPGPGFEAGPDEVELEVRSASGTRRESMVRGGDGMEFVAELVNLVESVEFRLSSREAETEWLKVELVDRPRIAELKLMAVAPEYTGGGSRELPVGAGPYYLLGGTRLEVTGRTDKALARAALKLGDREYPLEIADGGFRGAVDAGALEAGTYELAIEDTERMALPGEEGLVGLGPREPVRFKIRLSPDKKPRVQVALEGVSGMVVPGVRLPFRGSVTDDYAVEKVALLYEWKQDASEEEEPRRGELPTDGIITEVSSNELEIAGGVEIGPLDVPVNSRLSVTVRAEDNNLVSGPGIGESPPLLLRVVGVAELRADLLRREKEQRGILGELVKKQDLLLTDVGALDAETREMEELDPSADERLVAIQKQQKLMASNLRPIIERLQGMVQEIVNNRLEEEDGILKERLNTKVIAPLKRVAEVELAGAALALDAARREGDPVARAEDFATAMDAQRRAIAAMDEVLTHMVRNETYQMAVNLLYEIQRAQERIQKLTEGEKAEQLGTVIEDRPDGGGEPKPEPESQPGAGGGDSAAAPTAPADS